MPVGVYRCHISSHKIKLHNLVTLINGYDICTRRALFACYILIIKSIPIRCWSDSNCILTRRNDISI